MTPEEINVQRRERNLPLEDFSEGMEEVPEEPQEDTQATNDAEIHQEEGERVNFRITDTDLGAGGPKAKFRANMPELSLISIKARFSSAFISVSTLLLIVATTTVCLAKQMKSVLS